MLLSVVTNVAGMVELGIDFTALALMGWSIMSILDGSALSAGQAVRDQLKTPLSNIRETSSLSRGELADNTMIVATMLAAFSFVVERSVISILVAAIFWWARPLIQRATAEERPMFAIGTDISSNLVVGMYLPMTLALLIQGKIVLAMSSGAVMVALCWPPGIGSAGGSQWSAAFRQVRITDS